MGSQPVRFFQQPGFFHVRPGLGIFSWPPIRRLIDVVPVLFSLHRLAAPLYRYIATQVRVPQNLSPDGPRYSMVLDDTMGT